MSDADTGAQPAIDPSIETVEMKITARAQDEERVISALERRGIEPESRQVYFYDTPDLALFNAGVVLRSRLRRDDADDSTVKLRPVDPAELDESWKQTDGFAVEIDMVGAKMVCSAKLTVEQRRDEIREVADGQREVVKLFSGDQERFLEANAPAGVEWSDLTVLGPIEVQKWEFEPKGLGHEVTVEEWVLPDESNLVELSIKTTPAEVVDADREFKAYLEKHGFEIDDVQQTKTRTALAYFTGRTDLS
jgi:hypothetical protein